MSKIPGKNRIYVLRLSQKEAAQVVEALSLIGAHYVRLLQKIVKELSKQTRGGK